MASSDELFQRAVAAIDRGDSALIESLLDGHPDLASDRLETPGAWLRNKVGKALDGFFQRPYLLWFVAEDPVRNGSLPSNIADIARTIIRRASGRPAANLQEQLDYALKLVSWSWIAANCGVQLPLIDVLADAGASLDGNPDDALVNHQVAAAAHLVHRGARLTLPTALCLERWDDVTRLTEVTSAKDQQFGFILAALNGNAEAVRRMIAIGVTVNAPAEELYPHAVAIHHAVSSASKETVRVLVEAGALLNVKDTAWHATPLGWAEHCAGEQTDRDRKQTYVEIARYLRSKGAVS